MYKLSKIKLHIFTLLFEPISSITRDRKGKKRKKKPFFRSSLPEVSIKKIFFKVSQNSQENTKPDRSSPSELFLRKHAANSHKNTHAKVQFQ